MYHAGCKKPQEASTLHTEVQEIEESCKQERWPSPRRSTPTGCPVPNDQPREIHTSNVIWTQQLMFWDICMQQGLVKREAMNLEESKEYMGDI